MYPNGVHCASDDHCVATLEGETCSILLTRDGGAMWKEVSHDEEPGCSLVAVRFLDDKEVWVGGGRVSQGAGNFEGRFWHSLDGGETWEKEAVPNVYIISFDLRTSASGHAIAWDRAALAQLWSYQSGGAPAAPVERAAPVEVRGVPKAPNSTNQPYDQ